MIKKEKQNTEKIDKTPRNEKYIYNINMTRIEVANLVEKWFSENKEIWDTGFNTKTKRELVYQYTNEFLGGTGSDETDMTAKEIENELLYIFA